MLKSLRTATLGVVLSLCMSVSAFAQISLSAENMALGGGGTAYLTGYEALFVNPANLHIQEKNYSLQISLLQGGVYNEYLLPETDFSVRSQHFRSAFLPYKSLNSDYELIEADRSSILRRNYPGSRRVAPFQSMADLHWFGVKWQGDRKSYALSLRSRVFSKYELGKGYFSSTAVKDGDNLYFDRSFRHQYQTMHELSFGYAETFDFLSGLSPQLSEFIVGIAPKIVVAGSRIDARYDNVYEYHDGDENWIRSAQYQQGSTGSFTDNQSLFNQNDTFSFLDGSFSELSKPAGVGFGLDVGITYMITFGGDLSLLQREKATTRKSLRLSFSITDLGAIYQFDKPYKMDSQEIEEELTELPGVSDIRFSGAPNEHWFFLNDQDDTPFELNSDRSEDTFYSMMPTSIQAGALFQINRIKLMSDVRLPVINHEFASKAPVVYLGTELKLLPFLPLRFGTRIAPHLPGYYTLGIGFESKYFELNTALKVKSSQIGPTNEIVGASMAGIKIYIP